MQKLFKVSSLRSFELYALFLDTIKWIGFEELMVFDGIWQALDVDMKGLVGFHSLQEGLKKLSHLKPQIHLSNDDFKRITRNGELCNARGQLDSTHFEVMMREEICRFMQGRLAQAYDECIQSRDYENAAKLGGLKLLVKREAISLNSATDGAREDQAIDVKEAVAAGMASVAESIRNALHEAVHTSLQGIKRELRAELHNLRTELKEIKEIVHLFEDLQAHPAVKTAGSLSPGPARAKAWLPLPLKARRRRLDAIPAQSPQPATASATVQAGRAWPFLNTLNVSFPGRDQLHPVSSSPLGMATSASTSKGAVRVSDSDGSLATHNSVGSDRAAAGRVRASFLKVICENDDEDGIGEVNVEQDESFYSLGIELSGCRDAGTVTGNTQSIIISAVATEKVNTKAESTAIPHFHSENIGSDRISGNTSHDAADGECEASMNHNPEARNGDLNIFEATFGGDSAAQGSEKTWLEKDERSQLRNTHNQTHGLNGHRVTVNEEENIIYISGQGPALAGLNDVPPVWVTAFPPNCKSGSPLETNLVTKGCCANGHGAGDSVSTTGFSHLPSTDFECESALG